MIKSIAILLGLLLGAPSFLLSLELTSENRMDAFLFCIKKEFLVLEISRDDEGKFLSVSNEEIQSFVDANAIIDIQRWLPNANENDYDGDIFLNRIYSVNIGSNRETDIASLILDASALNSVLYSEPQNIHKVLYTPNDSNIDNQCSFASLKAFNAYNFWDISEGNYPGADSNIEVVLASVDTGVDYTHPDLMYNAWINQDEVPSWVLEIGFDIDGDGEVTAYEIISFLESESMDYNEDGDYNLRDILHESSPFINGDDDDSNSYVDDIIGLDCSGYYGNSPPDVDPYPREGVANTGTWAHGTHVAGILAATTDNAMGMASVSYNAKFMSVKASWDNQTEPGINDGYQGILYAAKAGHKDLNNNNQWDAGESFTIINNSWGGGGYSSSENSTINVAHDTYGAVIVCAAGNGDDDGGHEYAAHYPSSYTNSISVCAIGCSGNWGNWATYHSSIDLAAPGENIFSAVIGSGYDSWDGSSMASPNAASAIGLLSLYYPDFNNEELRSRIEDTADDFIYDLNPEFVDCNGSSGMHCLGTGMVDVYKAIGLSFSPSISIESVVVNLTDGDGDSVLNPGESAELIVTIENEEGWTDASNVSASLECSNAAVTILSGSASYDNINASQNESATFTVHVDTDIELGEIVFELAVSAQGLDGYSYSNNLEFSIPVSLYQDGFPFVTDFEVKSSPIPVDFDNDGDFELVFGDKNGLVHIVSQDGSEWETDLFPFDTGDEIWGAIAYADLDLDGFGEIVVTSKSKHLYALNANGVLFDFDAGQYLMGTPAIGNLDEDAFLEVVVSGYTSSGDIFIVNHDESSTVIEINEKALGGVSLADFDGDSIDEIVIATESNDMLCVVDYEGTIDTLYIAEDKFKVSPSVVNVNNQKLIMVGSHDNNFYAFDSSGEIVFSVQSSDEINSSAAFLGVDQGVMAIFGSDDGQIFSVFPDGSIPEGWPIQIDDEVGTASFSDLDGDGSAEIIVPANNNIYVFNQDVSNFNSLYFPIQTEFPLTSAPLIHDIDGDDDLELIIGSSLNLIAIDIMSQGGVNSGYWNLYRGNNMRSGYFDADASCSNIQLGNLNCDQNIDIFDIIITVNIILGNITPSDIQLWAADIDGNQEIDVSDIVTIINMIIG